MTVHGDDFTSSASTKNLEWLKKRFESKFDITAKILGPEVGQEREIRVLNRVIRWEADGLVYEPDQRHAEMIVREFGLEGAGSVLTPGTRAEQEVASAPAGILGLKMEDEPEEMAPADATRFRGLAARGNYLAQDRVDLQYACKEASRRMARPRVGDWQLLKRIARYLVGAPRYEQRFRWQDRPSRLDIFMDSDWAGCKTTCRSTSGGVALWGNHCIKTWSSTQATIALSSAEAELYALTKGAGQGLGMMTLMEDLGVPTSVTVHTDASAAIGIVRRAGLGKLRHLNVRYLLAARPGEARGDRPTESCWSGQSRRPGDETLERGGHEEAHGSTGSQHQWWKGAECANAGGTGPQRPKNSVFRPAAEKCRWSPWRRYGRPALYASFRLRVLRLAGLSHDLLVTGGDCRRRASCLAALELASACESAVRASREDTRGNHPWEVS